jgi:hypothetical protein
VLAIAAMPAGAVAVPATASAGTSCATGWGSLPKANTWRTSSTLESVRTGQHDCFDRIVFDIAGKPGGYRAKYVPNVFRTGAGHLVPLRGGAKFEIVLGVDEFDADGQWAYQEREIGVRGYRTFRQVESAGSNEGEHHFGIGLRARLPYRIFILEGPGTGGRIVLDVAHRW